MSQHDFPFSKEFSEDTPETTNQRNSLRELMLDRIFEIGKITNNFSLTMMRWENIRVKGFPLCLIKFDELTDLELLSVFETIIRQYYKSM